MSSPFRQQNFEVSKHFNTIYPVDNNQVNNVEPNNLNKISTQPVDIKSKLKNPCIILLICIIIIFVIAIIAAIVIISLLATSKDNKNIFHSILINY
jgi:hypothetical protein